MKTLIATIILMFTTSMVYSQDIAGQWNGALRVQGNQIRIVFHITKTNSRYEATLDSPDQNASGIKVTATNFSYPNVTFEIQELGAVYEGKITDKSITVNGYNLVPLYFSSYQKMKILCIRKTKNSRKHLWLT